MAPFWHGSSTSKQQTKSKMFSDGSSARDIELPKVESMAGPLRPGYSFRLPHVVQQALAQFGATNSLPGRVAAAAELGGFGSRRKEASRSVCLHDNKTDFDRNAFGLQREDCQ